MSDICMPGMGNGGACPGELYSSEIIIPPVVTKCSTHGIVS